MHQATGNQDLSCDNLQWSLLVRLERWGADIAAARQLLGDHDTLRGGEADMARRMFRRIKEGLRSQSGGAGRSDAANSDLERQYRQALRAAYESLRSRVHGPPGARWARDLESALTVINDAIHQVRSGNDFTGAVVAQCRSTSRLSGGATRPVDFPPDHDL